jgi:hypothetical protein
MHALWALQLACLVCRSAVIPELLLELEPVPRARRAATAIALQPTRPELGDEDGMRRAATF